MLLMLKWSKLPYIICESATFGTPVLRYGNLPQVFSYGILALKEYYFMVSAFFFIFLLCTFIRTVPEIGGSGDSKLFSVLPFPNRHVAFTCSKICYCFHIDKYVHDIKPNRSREHFGRYLAAISHVRDLFWGQFWVDGRQR